MRVTGSDTQHGPVTLIIRVQGSAYNGGFGASGQPVTVTACFKLVFANSIDDGEPRRAGCPATPPVSYAPLPDPPRLTDATDAALLAALPKIAPDGVPDESAVRAAVASLGLDPRVLKGFVTADGAVGVGILATRYDCILARVAPGQTKV